MRNSADATLAQQLARTKAESRMRELPEQTRFANAGLADDSDDLTVPVTRKLKSASKLLQFGVPPDESGETASSRCLEACPNRSCPANLIYFDRLA